MARKLRWVLLLDLPRALVNRLLSRVPGQSEITDSTFRTLNRHCKTLVLSDEQRKEEMISKGWEGFKFLRSYWPECRWTSAKYNGDFGCKTPLNIQKQEGEINEKIIQKIISAFEASYPDIGLGTELPIGSKPVQQAENLIELCIGILGSWKIHGNM